VKLHSRRDLPALAIIAWGISLVFGVSALIDPSLRAFDMRANGERVPPGSEATLKWQLEMAAVSIVLAVIGILIWRKWRRPNPDLKPGLDGAV
jgi:hypothetical protein